MKKSLLLIMAWIWVAISAAQTYGLQTGAEQTEKIMEAIAGKRIGVVANQTSVVKDMHLIDHLMAQGVRPVRIFTPEHGFRGKADAGENVKDGKDSKTDIDIVSLYGKNKKPRPEQLAGIDMIIFDLQDVGVRFYTYISTLYYVMEACAENKKQLLVLDRPNPNDQIDGPVLERRFRSFVGIIPIPVMHGCTMGEIAQMINGEGWLKNEVKCELKVIGMKGWKHGQAYTLPVKPSPNLPNDKAIELYPSLCLFEATSVSVGRGTYTPFQVIGSPMLPQEKYPFCFVPQALEGFDKHPLHKDKNCYGKDLKEETMKGKGFSMRYFLEMRNEYKKQGCLDKFLTRPQWMDLLMGTDQVRKMIEEGKSEAEIRASWDANLKAYKIKRKKYLLYKE